MSYYLLTFTTTLINCVYHMCNVDVLPVINNELIRTAVINGGRPSLAAITGPAELVSFATRWIPVCWHKSPDQRPSFHGKVCIPRISPYIIPVYLSPQIDDLWWYSYINSCWFFFLLFHCSLTCVSVAMLYNVVMINHLPDIRAMSLPPLNLYIFMNSSVFNPIAALVPLM